ncbi:MAG: peptidoglycan editing factor PgeF [Woeseia sp.]
MNAPEWMRADWPAPPGVIAGTTLRQGGVSGGRYASLNLAAHVGDDPGAVEVNRERLRNACGLPAEPRWLTQVHGAAVVPAKSAAGLPEADAIVATQPEAVCAILTADCLPVVFATSDGEQIAAAHAGWRGICAGVLEATLAAIGAAPSAVLVWLGPAISQEAFEVGKDVREAFLARDEDAAPLFERNPGGRWQADLAGLARLRLRKAGVSQIYGGGRCTFREAGSFFSYRRDGQCGRMATFIFRRGSRSGA